MKFSRMDTPFFFHGSVHFFRAEKKQNFLAVCMCRGRRGLLKKGGGEIEDLPKLDKIHLYKSMKFVLNAYSFE